MDKEYFKRYYKKHREKKIAKAREWQVKNAEYRRDYIREWVKSNREKIKDYRRKTADRRNAARRKQYASNPKMREQYKKQAKEWQAKNPRKRLDQRMRRYGITASEYERLFEIQCGKCAICKIPNCGDSRGGRFHVDHCHATKRVRGLLCTNCNLGIGKFHDDPIRLEQAAMYLRTGIK